MVIDTDTRLADVKNRFRSHYPFLKLEFFAYAADESNRYSKDNIISDDFLTLYETGHILKGNSISINGHQKVKTFEDKFREQFGIYVQVFRKSGNSWLQTRSTDDWTLSQQNRLAAERTVSAGPEQLEEDSYHEQL